MPYDKTDPQSVAVAFYEALADGDEETFRSTLTTYYQKQMQTMRGSSPSLWWSTGRRYHVQYGVRWHFVEEESNDGKTVKLFFQRKHPDGSHRGYPVPITLIFEEGRWAVEMATP